MNSKTYIKQMDRIVEVDLARVNELLALDVEEQVHNFPRDMQEAIYDMSMNIRWRWYVMQN